MTGRTPYQGRFEGTSIGDKEAVYRAFSLTKADKLKDKKFANLKRRRKTKDCDCTRGSTNHTLDAS